jgi:hypothetical protein
MYKWGDAVGVVANIRSISSSGQDSVVQTERVGSIPLVGLASFFRNFMISSTELIIFLIAYSLTYAFVETRCGTIFKHEKSFEYFALTQSYLILTMALMLGTIRLAYFLAQSL